LIIDRQHPHRIARRDTNTSRSIPIHPRTIPAHEEIPNAFVAAVFEVMARAEHHVFEILTKRPERLMELAPDLPWPDNVWIGVSIENRRLTVSVRTTRLTAERRNSSPGRGRQARTPTSLARVSG
jgi:protein gp37